MATKEEWLKLICGWMNNYCLLKNISQIDDGKGEECEDCVM